MSETIDEKEESFWCESGFVCSECSEEIAFTDDIYSITIVCALVTANGLVYEPLMSYDDDYLFEPLFMCFTCWESAKEDLAEKLEDIPPIEDMYAIHECDVCKSSIRNGEVLGLATLGNMYIQDRVPTGIAKASFVSTDPDPTVLCIACINIMNEDVCALWADEDRCPEPIQQSDECKEGTYARCWRAGCPADGKCGNGGGKK